MDTNSMKREVLFESSTIQLDKDEIKNSISTQGNYEDPGVFIKNWEGEKESEYYIGTLSNERSSYVGVLNVKLKRQNYGLNKYDNGDYYFGFFDNDQKAQHGAYFYKPKNENGLEHSEMYYGFWKENQKDHHGIYLWKSEPKGNIDFNSADFDCYVGSIEKDHYKKGCYLSKIGESFYVYYGKFNIEGRKNDENAYFFDSGKERAFTGKIINDKFVDGYLINFDEHGVITNTIFVEFDSNENPTKLLKTEEIDNTIKHKIGGQVSKFRNILLEEDHFTMVYEKTNEIKNFAENRMDNTDALDSESGYPKIMKLGAAYNDVKIYTKLEKAMN